MRKGLLPLVRLCNLALQPVPGLANVVQTVPLFGSLVAAFVLAVITGDFATIAACVLLVALALFVLAGLKLQGRVDALQVKVPILRFGDITVHGKTYISPNHFINDVKMWRIAVINDGGQADNVRVTGTFTPRLPDMSGSQPIVTFHRFADSERTFLLHGNGGTEYVDLVASPKNNPIVSFVCSAEADGGYIYYEDDMLGEPRYWKLELEARSGISLAQKTIYIWFDGKQWMYMAETKDGNPIGL